MNQRLDGFEIVLGVTGGIAAYKSAWLCSQLVQAGVGVTVAMTDNACRFVTELTFATLSGRRVYRSLWSDPAAYEANHISLTSRADLIVIAPATANIIAKAAAGICDDLLSTLPAAAQSPILLAPAMNQRMWASPAAQRNIAQLREDGYHIVGPAEGRLACGDVGPGRMAEPEDIFRTIGELLTGQTPKTKRR
ncbi:MAG: phosphopantothenoylcysteine decarboxylase [Sedimentisphaerales bacterium]|nr:phosphopantothenoylcysteine decarboxylase [Sedimentisphaerales bacterium]